MKPSQFADFDNNREAFDELVSTLLNESDRGCALIVASILDTALEELLYAHFVDDQSVVSNILGQMRPLGTFSARIDIAYLLGFLNSKVHRDLHLIRKIRNDFGHSMSSLSFDDPRIRPRCLEIETMRGMPSPTKTRFIMAAMWFLGVIQGATGQTTHRVCRNPDITPSTPESFAEE